MTAYDTDDRTLIELATLPPLIPDSGRAARIRARCEEQLRRRAAEQATPLPGYGRRLLAPGVVLTLCALYLASLVSTVLRLRSIL